LGRRLSREQRFNLAPNNMSSGLAPVTVTALLALGESALSQLSCRAFACPKPIDDLHAGKDRTPAGVAPDSGDGV